MPAEVDVDSLWAALQQGSVGTPRVTKPGIGNLSIFSSSKQPRHSQSAKTEQSSVELPALKLETTQQKLQAADCSEKLAALKALKVATRRSACIATQKMASPLRKHIVQANVNVMKENQALLLELGKALILRLADAKEQVRILACNVLIDVVQVW